MTFVRSTFQFAKESLNMINLNSRKDLLHGTACSEYAHPQGITHLPALRGIQKGLLKM